MPPIIGITTNRDRNALDESVSLLTQAYVAAVLQGGGVPILIPSLLAEQDVRSLYPHLDGILFSGGGDIAVERFGAKTHPRVEDVDPPRDALELNLLKTAASDGKPFLGICRGCQVLNVALGGTLYTHLPDQLTGALDHDYPGNLRAVLVHAVEIEDGTLLREVLGEHSLRVNSHHHQGLKDIGLGLRIAGSSPDGLVEAVELRDHPFGIGVQWHPEWLTDQAPARLLFKRFVDAAASPARQ